MRSPWLLLSTLAGFLFAAPSLAADAEPFAEDLSKVEGIAFCPDGSLYVSETQPGTVHLLSADGTPEKSWPLEGALGLHCTTDSVLYANSFKNGTVHKLVDDELVQIADGMKGPNALAQLPDGRVLVSDSQGGTIYELTGDGAKPFLEKLIYPNGMAYVPDQGLHVNSTTGRYVALVDSITEPKKFKKVHKGLMVPDGATVGPDGALYICEFGKGQVLRFGADGKKTVVAKGMTSPASLQFGTGGWGGHTLYVTSLMGKGLYKIENAAPAVEE